jgi:mannose-1-phosphate guanylyltransferase
MLNLVVMAGGSGTRFWPESRRAFPKQFLRLSGGRSLLQQAVDRCAGLIPAERIFVVTGRALAQETMRQLPEIPQENLLLEPCGRNTAPCIGLAAMAAQHRDPHALLLVCPADHLIEPIQAFQETVAAAARLVEGNPRACVLLGVRPRHAATGYGYIERGEKCGEAGAGAFRVASFQEKPNLATAQSFLQAGRFYWNAGIFVWSSARILGLLARFQPHIGQVVEELRPAWQKPQWQSELDRLFARMPSISIDYGVLEPQAAEGSRDAELFVVEAAFQWDDVGSWQSLPAVLGQDDRGNSVVGPHAGIETTGCVIRTTPDHLVATVGLHDFVVVHTADATLVAPKGDEAALRQLVALLAEQGHEKYL